MLGYCFANIRRVCKDVAILQELFTMIVLNGPHSTLTTKMFWCMSGGHAGAGPGIMLLKIITSRLPPHSGWWCEPWWTGAQV